MDNWTILQEILSILLEIYNVQQSQAGMGNGPRPVDRQRPVEPGWRTSEMRNFLVHGEAGKSKEARPAQSAGMRMDDVTYSGT